ncbi:uncharacterized protein F4822DRAFT_104409 [Hypoxylon trugodes]|uniref:uncharacterized protein n=1 Tax=Hypoxylon trugodes TaxID=326681 RepID=UPI00219A24FF|nr:uncharacterized protein F4822DRAFT_104409 [Hypoxylon trugodes]KAI1391739.1 hypothetical protein F4822DRAFT_104409 [Hypoxylon trugodes]
MEYSDSDRLYKFFDGAVSVRVFDKPEHAYCFEASFRPDHPLASSLFSRKPPLHFHPYQDEQIKVLSGQLIVDVEGQEHRLSPNDAELRVRRWAHHRLRPSMDDPEKVEIRALVTGQKSSQLFREDVLFLENWYRYQDDIVMNKKKVELLQILAMFDAGGTYLSFPTWIPFGKTISRITGIVLGRWLGGMLGYQPFYREWSTDWNLACLKMESSNFQKRFANRARTE